MINPDIQIQSLREQYLHGQLNAVLWDMDGVLVDTMPAHARAFEIVLQRRGRRLPDNFLAWGSGRTDRDILARAIQAGGVEPDAPLLDAIVAEKVTVFLEIVAQGLQPVPGVPQWLAWLNTKGVACALASSSAMGVITAVLHAIGLQDEFAALISGVKIPNSKPHPAIFLAAAAAVNAPPEACLVVEDAPVGVEAAHRAGMTCIALATTLNREQLHADLVLRDLSELPPQAIFP